MSGHPSTDALPSGWTLTSLAAVTENGVEQTGPRANGTFTYVDIGSIDNEAKRIVAARPLAADAAPSRARQALRVGDVLVSMTRPGLNAVALVPPELDGAIGSTGFHVLRATPVVRPTWLHYAVQTTAFVRSMSADVQGALYPAVRPHDVRSWRFPLPPLAEQSRIVEVVDELLSDVDAGVASLEQARTKLTAYRASVLKAAVNGTFTAEWRKEHPHVEPASDLLDRILAERRRWWEQEQLARYEAKGQRPPRGWQARYQPPITPPADKRSSVPESWCVATVDQLARVGTGATPNRSQTARYYAQGTIPWVTSSCVNVPLVSAPSEYVSEAALNECNLTLYPTGTLLLAMYGEGKTRGKFTELAIPSTTNQALAALVPADGMRSFLKLFLAKNYDEMRRVASGGVQPNLNLGLVREVALPLPPRAEQEAIVELVDDQLSVVDHLEVDLDAKLRTAHALRQSILRHAFTGQLVPQDPADEPASALLARIAAEREARTADEASGRPRQRGRRGQPA